MARQFLEAPVHRRYKEAFRPSATGDWKESINPTQYLGLLEEKTSTFPDFNTEFRRDASPRVKKLHPPSPTRQERSKQTED
ncbi:MAG: hypothetical protein GY696_08555 [Gammaproteobacteria bacterium]|nr:hypothetical protein [Gammaproteobacteria bacterium]